jgi:hypothetical protein
MIWLKYCSFSIKQQSLATLHKAYFKRNLQLYVIKNKDRGKNRQNIKW